MFDIVTFRKIQGDLISSLLGKDFMDEFFGSDILSDTRLGMKVDIKENEKEYISK